MCSVILQLNILVCYRGLYCYIENVSVNILGVLKQGLLKTDPRHVGYTLHKII